MGRVKLRASVYIIHKWNIGFLNDDIQIYSIDMHLILLSYTKKHHINDEYSNRSIQVPYYKLYKVI